MKLTPAIAAKLIEAVSLGSDRVQACAYAEIPFDAFRDWERKASLGDYPCTKLVRDIERAEVAALVREVREQCIPAEPTPTPSPADCPTCKAIMAELSREIIACEDRAKMETLAEVWSRLAHAHGLLPPSGDAGHP